jgi:hypothetical protein
MLMSLGHLQYSAAFKFLQFSGIFLAQLKYCIWRVKLHLRLKKREDYILSTTIPKIYISWNMKGTLIYLPLFNKIT